MSSKLVDRAWVLQQRIEQWASGIHVSLKDYLFYLMVLFMLIGMPLFVCVLIYPIGFYQLGVISDPLFYMGLSICCCLAFLCCHFYEKRMVIDSNK